MDNPGASLFQGTDINLNNSQNNEEEEDLEDQRRRNEELQNLLIAKLDDFNYDESTINSSTNVSLDEIQNKYRDATNPNEQLKVLYDVRVREINSLKEEYEKFKTEKFQEIESLKNKLFVYEAELQQLKISLKNSEDILVEKTGTIKELMSGLTSKEEQVNNYEKIIENFQLEVNTYQSTINELHLQFQKEKNPFNYGVKQFNSEELQKAHQEQIIRLETLLEQQTQSAKIYEKEKLALQEQLEQLRDIENEEKNALIVLTKNFESAQKQCEELVDLVEKLTMENRHLRNRVNSSYKDIFEDSQSKKVHDNSESSQIEKLKKMLLDKSIEVEALNSKLKNFENNSKEILEYRKLKCDVYNKEFQNCDNKEHTKSLLLMQNDLQNYRRTIEDKNQQILTLNSTNKDLLEKMEEMLSQTRNDIQNFSHKYNLPQLEKMAMDLKMAEEKIKQLEFKLEKSEENRHSLMQKLQKSSKSPDKELRKELEIQLNNFKSQSEKDRNNFENQMKKLGTELEVSYTEIKSLKQYIHQLISENTKLKTDLKNAKAESHTVMQTFDSTIADEKFKKQYVECSQNLHEALNKIKTLEETIQELTNAKTITEGEKCTYQYEVRDCESHLERLYGAMRDLETEVATLTKAIEDKDALINSLQQNPTQNDFEELKKELSHKENALKIFEQNKKELVELLQKANGELEESKKEVLELRNELAELTEKQVKRNLEKELKEAENLMEQNKREEGGDAIDLLKIELNVREEIQQEYIQKLKEIEKKYQKSCISSKDLYKELAEKLKTQENRFREQLGLILKECAHKIKGLEEDRQDLVIKNNNIQADFEHYRTQVAISEEAYKKTIKETQLSAQKNIDEWKRWSKKFVSNCLKIDEINKTTRDTVVNKMKSYDTEVAAVEKCYNEKIKKYVQKL